ETAALYGGDDSAFLRALSPVDATNPSQLVSAAWRGTKSGGFKAQAATVGNLLRDPKGGHKLATAHCDLAVALAGCLGMNDRIVEARGQIYERYDGKGSPAGLRGDQIDLPARILNVAWRVEVHLSLLGPTESVSMVKSRSGGELDPQVAEAFLRRA